MAPKFTPSREESALVNAIFAKADTQKLGVLTGDVAVDAFGGSNLPPSTLGEIWALADDENQGFLTKLGVAVAVRLIGWAQKGESLNSGLIQRPGPLATIDGISSPAAVASHSTGTALPRTPTGVPPPLTPQDKTKFMKLFVGCGPINGLLSGEKARDVFLKSKLPFDKLSQIWTLSDTQNRGALDSTDFTIGMYLIQACMSGQLPFVPTSLPPGLYDQAGGGKRGPDHPGVVTHNTGSSGLPSPATGAFPTRPMQPQTTGQALRPQYTGQGQGIQNRPSAVQLGSSAFGIPAQMTGQQQPQPWDVTAQEKANADRFFDDLDSDKKGFIEGDAAVPFMTQSGLPGDTLAQVWDLVDMNNDGRLTRDCFAVAVHLIQGKLAGKDIPSVLPPTLIPPSMRSSRGGPFGTAPAPAPPAPAASSALQDLLWDDAPPTSASPALQPQPTGQSAFPPPPQQRAAPPPIPSRTISPAVPPQDPFGSTSFGASLDKDLLGDESDDETPAPPPPQQDRSAEIGNARNQLSSTNRALDTAKSERANMEQAVANQAAELSSLETQLSASKAAYETETKLLETLRERFFAQTTDIQKAREQLIRAESDLSALRVEKSEIQGTLLREKDEVRALQKKMAEVGTEMELLKVETEKAKKDAKQQKGLLAIAKKQLVAREAERAKSEKEAEEARTDLMTATDEREATEAELGKEVENIMTNGPIATSASPNISSAPRSPDTVDFAATQPLPVSPEPTMSTLSSPSMTSPSKSNNPFDRLMGGGGPRSQSPFLPFANANLPTPVMSPPPAEAPPAEAENSPFGFQDAFGSGTLEESPAAAAAGLAAKASTEEHDEVQTPKIVTGPSLNALNGEHDASSPISNADVDTFTTPPSTATVPPGTSPFGALADSDANGVQAPESKGQPSENLFAPESNEEEADLSAPLQERELEESDSDSDSDDEDDVPLGNLNLDKGKSKAAEPAAPEPTTNGNGNGMPGGLDAFDDSFGITTPTTAASAGFPLASPPTATSTAPQVGHSPPNSAATTDAFGAAFTPTAVAQVPPAAAAPAAGAKSPEAQPSGSVGGVNDFDEALGKLPNTGEKPSFSFDSAFDDNFDFAAVGSNEQPSFPPVAASVPAQAQAPAAVAANDGFDSLFAPASTNANGQPPAPAAAPTIPPVQADNSSFSFDDAFGTSKLTPAAPSAHSPSANGGTANGTTAANQVFDQVFGTSDLSQSTATYGSTDLSQSTATYGTTGTASSKMSAASQMTTDTSNTSFPTHSPPSSPPPGSSSVRTVSPPPQSRPGKPRSSTASSEEKAASRPDKLKEPRHSRLSIRLPFGKKKKDKHEQLPPMPTSQSMLSPPVEEPASFALETEGGTPGEADDVQPVKQLCGMGFSRTQAIEALEKHGYDVQRALNSLLGAA